MVIATLFGLALVLVISFFVNWQISIILLCPVLIGIGGSTMFSRVEYLKSKLRSNT